MNFHLTPHKVWFYFYFHSYNNTSTHDLLFLLNNSTFAKQYSNIVKIKCLQFCYFSKLHCGCQNSQSYFNRFEIASDDNCGPIVGGTPDVCHSLLLQKINDALSLNVVSIRPRGNDFFGLTHPTIQNLIQSSPGTRKCSGYKWSKFEVSKNGDQYCEDADAALNYESLQRSIDFCKFKMGPDALQRSGSYYDKKDNFKNYF